MHIYQVWVCVRACVCARFLLPSVTYLSRKSPVKNVSCHLSPCDNEFRRAKSLHFVSSNLNERKKVTHKELTVYHTYHRTRNQIKCNEIENLCIARSWVCAFRFHMCCGCLSVPLFLYCDWVCVCVCAYNMLCSWSDFWPTPTDQAISERAKVLFEKVLISCDCIRVLQLTKEK